MEKVKKLKKHLDSFLPLYVALAIVVGFLFGIKEVHFISKNKELFKTLNMIVIIAMIYTMMVGLNFSELKNSFKKKKEILVALFVGLVIPPLIMALFSFLFRINSEIAFRLILATSVPCSSMAIAYTGLSKGNVELATIIAAASFLLSLITVPVWLKIFASTYHINSPILLIIRTIILVIILPMILGYITRRLIERKGKEYFKKIKPILPVISLLGLYLIVFLIFSEKAFVIIKQGRSVIVSLLPITLFFVLMIPFIAWIAKLFKISYKYLQSLCQLYRFRFLSLT